MLDSQDSPDATLSSANSRLDLIIPSIFSSKVPAVMNRYTNTLRVCPMRRAEISPT